MIGHYLRSAFKAVQKHKQHVAMSVLGLSIGVALSLMMAFFVRHELAFDRAQPNAEQHFRLVMHAQESGNEYILTTPRAASQLKAISGIKDVFYLFNTKMAWDGKIKVGENAYQLEDNYALSRNITQLINIEVLAGELNNALQKPAHIALSNTQAKRIFGNAPPYSLIGRTMQRAGDLQVLTVAAVFADLPVTSHFYFSSLMSYEPYKNIKGNVAHTYVAVQSNSALDVIAKQVSTVFADIWQWKNVAYRLQPLRDIHLGENYGEDMKPGGAFITVVIGSVLSILVLLISCINYVNFSIAQATSRAKEVAIRKALGATRAQLTLQFIFESILIAFISVIVACMLVDLSMPHFNAVLGRSIVFEDWEDWLLELGALTLVLGIVSGIYPSMFISGFTSNALLKGVKNEVKQTARIRKTLLTLQFSVAMSLIVVAVVVKQQLDFLHALPVNYGKSQQWVIDDVPATAMFDQNNLNLYRVLTQLPGVSNVTATDFDITQSTNAGIFITNKHNPDSPFALSYAGVSSNVVSTFDLQLIAGRDFSLTNSADWYNATTQQASVILPESSLKLLGFDNAQSAINQTIQFAAGPVRNATGRIVGVVKDIKVGSVNHQSAPVVLVCGLPIGGRYSLIVKVDNTDQNATKQAIAAAIKRHLNIAPVAISSLLDNYTMLYDEQHTLSKVMQYGCLIAIILILMGVFGLTYFVIEQKQRQVAIRKVLGSSRLSIVHTFYKEFYLLIFVSILCAFPITYWLVGDWLAGFNERIDQSVWVYLLAAIVVAAITWLTVASLAFKAASTRPSLILRDE